jgi:hypothetical protein
MRSRRRFEPQHRRSPCGAAGKEQALVLALKAWLEQQLARVSAKATIAEDFRYGLNHWDGLIRFLDDDRIELDSNIVERSMRPIVLIEKMRCSRATIRGRRARRRDAKIQTDKTVKSSKPAVRRPLSVCKAAYQAPSRPILPGRHAPDRPPYQAEMTSSPRRRSHRRQSRVPDGCEAPPSSRG